ncbi:MAG TPA: hypothetical protein VKP30_10740 [Polyangiaceae bacterium]|nr:hypothetical protein [Polyangiaceae bacterium]
MSRLFTFKKAPAWLVSRDVVLEFTLLLAGLIIVYPLWVTLRPPIQDLPQHVAAVRVLASYGDAPFRFREYFDLTLGKTQYLTVYLAALPLAKVVGPTIATKAILSVALIATPMALLRLVRALEFEPWLACMCLPLVFNVHVAYGFLNFLAAIPLMLWSLAIAVELQRRPTWQGQVWLGTILLVCFFTHVVPFGLSVIACASLTGRDRRAWTRQALVLLPAMLAAVLWLFTSPAGRVVASLGQTVGSTPSAAHLPFGMALRVLPDWLLHVTTAEDENLRLIVWALAGLVLLVSSVTWPAVEQSGRPVVWGRFVVLALVPLSMCAYFALPNGYGFIWPICQRFPVLALILGVLLFGRAPRRAIQGAAALAIILAALGAAEQTRIFRKAGEDGYHGFDAVLAQIPRGSRVATLVFERQLEGLQLSPLMHAAGWVQAERGGFVMFTFAEFPSSPFTYRSEKRPPRIPPRWEWGPERVVPDRDLGWYDYCLVQGWSGSLEHSRRFSEVVRRGRWSLWRRNGPADPSPSD